MTHKTVEEVEAEMAQLQDDLKNIAAEPSGIAQEPSDASGASTTTPEVASPALAHSPVPARAIKSPAFEAKANAATHSAQWLTRQAMQSGSLSIHKQAEDAHALASSLWAAVGNNRQAAIHANAQASHASAIQKAIVRVKR